MFCSSFAAHAVGRQARIVAANKVFFISLWLNGEERWLDRRVDNGLGEVNNGAVWSAGGSMNLPFKLDPIDRLIGNEGDGDCPVSLFVDHGFGKPCLRIKRDPPLHAAFR